MVLMFRHGTIFDSERHYGETIMSKSDHDHDPFQKAGYSGQTRPYGTTEDENRRYEKGRLDRQAEEQQRHRDNWGKKDER